MKTHEEIKIGLECCEKYMNGAPEEECCHVCNYQYNCAELKLDALALIQQLEAQVPKWISVEERLPETQVTVVLALKRDGGGSRIAIGSRAHWTPFRYYIDGGTCAVDAGRVTHWMPLPEPPKEEERKAAEWEK